MDQDLAHRRPFLFISLLVAISYPISHYIDMPDLAMVAWKMAAVGCLALYALRNHNHGNFLILAVFLAFYALGDGLVEFDLIWGAIAFATGHIIAIYLFSRYRRPHLSPSQITLACTLPIIVPFIAWAITRDATESGFDAALYSLLLAIMAAMAWSSAFPRYRTGLGAILFILSDLLLFSRFKIGDDNLILNLSVWYSYYFGVFLITTGIVQTLRKKGT